MFPKFSPVDLDSRNFDYPTEERFIVLVDGTCYTGEFAYYAVSNYQKKAFISDSGKRFPLTSIEKLWSIHHNETPSSIQEKILQHNPLVYGTLPLTSYPGWYFIIQDYNDPSLLRLNIVLPRMILKGLTSDDSNDILFNERFSTMWGWLFCENNDARCSFEMIPNLDSKEAMIAAGIERMNEVSREINSRMANSIDQVPIIWGNISLGFVTSTCQFNGATWKGVLTVCLPTEDGEYLRENLRSCELLFGQHLTHNWGELSNRYRCVKIPVSSRTKQGIEDEKNNCITTVIDTFQRITKLQNRVDFILFLNDMVKYYHGPVPPGNIQIGVYHMTTIYQHDKWVTELSLHIPHSDISIPLSGGSIIIPYLNNEIQRQGSDKPSLLGEKLWPLWGTYTPNFRFRTIMFSGITPDESRLAALKFIQDEKEQFLALTPWQFDDKN